MSLLFTVLALVAALAAIFWCTQLLPDPVPWRDDSILEIGCIAAGIPAALLVHGIGYLLGVYA